MEGHELHPEGVADMGERRLEGDGGLRSQISAEIVGLYRRGLVSYTDHLVICTARNERLARAVVDGTCDLPSRESA